MRSKRKRLWAVGRWGVYVCLGLMVLAIPLSLTIRPRVFINHLTGSTQQTFTIKHHYFVLDDGRVRYGSQTGGGTVIDGKGNLSIILPPTWTFEFSSESIDDVFSGLSPSERLRLRWFTPWSIFLPYPVLVLGGWLFGAAYLRKRKRVQLIGCCKKCEYSLEGLDGGVCPECGGELGMESKK